MANGRIISKLISLSERVNTISDGASLLYTWMIPHSDDFGLLQGSALTIKALVVPMRNWSIPQVEGFIEEMSNVGLIHTLNYENKKYFQILNTKQSLRKDRHPQTILPFEIVKDVSKNWQTISNILQECDSADVVTDSQANVNAMSMPVNASQMTAEGKGSEDINLKINRRNAVVDHVLEEFNRVYGHDPIDKKPRQTAWNLIQRLEGFVREIEGNPPDQERLGQAVTKYFNWVDTQKSLSEAKNLDVIKRNLEIYSAEIRQKVNHAKI